MERTGTNLITHKGRILLIPPVFSVGCLPFLVGFKILLFWYCLPKTVGLERFPNLLLHELEDFYRRYQDLIEKYQKSVKEMVNDSFPG